MTAKEAPGPDQETEGSSEYGRTHRRADLGERKHPAKNGFQEGQMGITAKEIVDALKAAQNGTAVKSELAEVKHGSEPEEEYDRSVAAKYRMCRIFGHAWDYTTAKREKGEFVQRLVCLRCNVQRAYRIDARNGDRLGSGGYDYQDAPGYLLKGGGPLNTRGAVEIAAP